MTSPAPTLPRPATRRSGLLLGLLGFLLCAALGQRVFYKTDGVDLLWLLHEGRRSHPWHVGYLPVLGWLRDLLAGTGLGLLRLGTLFSALGVGLAVWALHDAQRLLGAGRDEARAAALLLLLSPGVLLFGTVVEFHGPALGLAALAFAWTARQAGRPRAWGMVVLGGLTHAAFLMHGSLLFLPALLLPWFLARRWPAAAAAARRRALLLALLAAVVHGLLFVLLPRLWPAFYGDYADLGAALRREGSTGRPQGLEWTPVILWQEWIAALLPLSLAFLPAWWRRPLRPEILALLAGLLPFLYVCVRQLVYAPEHGAYLLPLLPLAARLTAAVWSGFRLWLLLGLSAVLALLQLWQHDRTHWPAYAAWRDGVAAAGAGAPYVLIDTHQELRFAFATLPHGRSPADPACRFVYVRSLATLPRAQWTPEHALGVLAFLEAQRAAGRVLVISAETVAALADPAAAARAELPTAQIQPSAELSGPLFLGALRERFAFEPDGARFQRLQPRR